MVIEIDVRNDGDPRPQCRHRPIRFVALDDEPAAAGPRIAAELRNVAADQPGWIATGPLEPEGDHRGGRRLAVCAGDDDRITQRHELGEQLRTALALHPVGERARHERLPLRRRRRRFVGDLHVDSVELLEIRRAHAVPAAHLGAPFPREARVPAHARTADAGDPEAATVKWRGQ